MEHQSKESDFNTSAFIAGLCTFVSCSLPINLGLFSCAMIYYDTFGCQPLAKYIIADTTATIVITAILLPCRGCTGATGSFIQICTSCLGFLVCVGFAIWGSLWVWGDVGATCALSRNAGVAGSSFLYIVSIILVVIKYVGLVAFPIACICIICVGLLVGAAEFIMVED